MKHIPIPARIFVSYAAEDVAFMSSLLQHLHFLKRRNRIQVWHDGLTTPGAVTEAERRSQLEHADIIILLVSASFIASPSCWEHDLQRALERRVRGGAHVVPIRIRPVELQGTPLASMEALPAGLPSVNDVANDAAWASICRAIAALIEGGTTDQWQSIRNDNEWLFANEFLHRVDRVCRLREEGAAIERLRAPTPFDWYWEVSSTRYRRIDFHPVAAFDGSPTPEILDLYRHTIDKGYRLENPTTRSLLVYRGAPPSDSLIQEAALAGIDLLSFAEYDGLIDFSAYVQSQTMRLAIDQIYPPGLYINQSAEQVYPVEISLQNAVYELTQLLMARDALFMLVLADFGTGKTFLLHELARRLGEKRAAIIPLLIDLRSLEKARSLDELLASHLARAGMRSIQLDALRDMLEEGKVALLFDGFDELAQRVRYDRAAEHLERVWIFCDNAISKDHGWLQARRRPES